VPPFRVLQRGIAPVAARPRLATWPSPAHSTKHVAASSSSHSITESLSLSRMPAEGSGAVAAAVPSRGMCCAGFAGALDVIFFQLLSLFPEIPADGDERAPAPMPQSDGAAFASCG
jgi:hypothetical protein